MPSAPMSSVLRFLHDAVAPKLDQCSDGELLHAFIARREEAAFAAIVRRHGALVLNVCRHVLGHEQDAEDAFQATFFVLARRADSLRDAGSLAAYLHGVAYRLSLKAKRDAARRRKHEKKAPPASQDKDALVWREVQALIEEEIERLPQKYRIPFIRCYLQGLSRAEAAHELGVKEGTIWSRLSWARQRLQERLSRRCVSISAALATLALSDRHGTAALSILREAVVRSARAFAARETLTDAAAVRAAALAQVGMHTFAVGKGKAAVVALFLLLTTSGGALLHVMAPQTPKEHPQAKTPLPPNNASKPARVDLHGDPLPDGAVARLGTIRFRMNGLVYACAFSPDGKVLAASSVDKEIVLFDAATGRQLRQLQGNSSAATSLAYAPDRRILAAGSENGGITIWNCDSAKRVREFGASSERGPLSPVWSLAFTPDGKGLISAGEDKIIRLWDPATGRETRRFTGHGKDVRCAVLSPDGRTLISAAGTEIRLWETATGKLIRRLTEHKKPIRSLAVSTDGKFLASCGEDGQIYMWEIDSGVIRHRLPKDAMQIQLTTSWHCLAFSPDGKILAAGGSGRDGSVYRLNLLHADTGGNHTDMAGAGNRTFEGGKYHDGGIQCVAFAPDYRKLVFGLDNLIEYCRIAPEKHRTLYSHYPGTVQQVFFHSNGQRLFTTSDDGGRQILEWDSTTGRQIRRVPDKAPWSQLVSFSPDGKLMATTPLGSDLLLWDTVTGKVARKIPIPFEVRFPGNQQVSFSPNGKQLFVVGPSGKSAGLFDVSTGKQLLSMGPEKEGTFAHVQFSCDNRLLAVIGSEAIRFFDTSSDRVLPSISLPQDCSRSTNALSPDGRTLAMASGEWVQETITKDTSHRVFKVRDITLWETAVGKKRGVFPSLLRIVYTLRFSPDGRLLAAGGNDRKVHLWDMLKSQWLRHFPGHLGDIRTLAFSRDGRRLASGSEDTTALIWDVSGLAKDLPLRNALTQKELDELWSMLADTDAAKAYRAIRTLATVADQSVPLLAERLRYKPSADAKQFAGLIAQLDSEDFAARERATTELRRLGLEAEPALRKVLEDKPSLEVRQRVKPLLDDIRKQVPPAKLLRMLRGIEILEQIGTKEARKVIAQLANGTTRPAREAKAALERLRSCGPQRK